MKNIALWILQLLLAAVFLAHGAFMIAPPASMIEIVNASIGPNFRVFIGVAEVLAVIGLLAPGITRIMPSLTVWAAAGLMVVMSSATVLHIVRAEYSSAVSAAILFALVTLVDYLRWKVMPIAPRQFRQGRAMVQSS
jgi:putative oxidoreductase